MKNGIGVDVDVKSLMAQEKPAAAKSFGPQVNVKSIMPEKEPIVEKPPVQASGRKNAMKWVK